MQRLNHALSLAAKGFYVFPCRPGEKLPAVKDWQGLATRDPEQINQWWSSRDFNIGISTSRFGDDKALVVVDVDTKAGKNGDAELFNLEMQGYELPVTLEQATPSGGRHIVYVADQPCKQGVDVLGSGLDIRSKGGFIVGPGSEIEGRPYHQINGHGTLAQAPAWLVDRLGQARTDDRVAGVVLDGVDPDRAARRAVEFLRTAPVAIEGQGGDHTTFKVACKLKDLGLERAVAFRLMYEHWNDGCQPPWSFDELSSKVGHAYRYGREPQGVDAPEAVFPKSEKSDGQEDDGGTHPVDALNSEYAFVKAGAFVLQETVDHKGRAKLERLSPNDMHAWFANKTLAMGDKQVPMSRLWMTSASRREYDSVVFSPLRDPGPRFYNLWRGFSVEPKAGGHAALDMFLEHAKDNVCNSDARLFNWLMGFFAHMIQRPWEKPLVGLVFQGQKGVGKNVVVERVGALLGKHFMVADDDRFLLSNFNSHLENNLFFVLDEAAWAGDKRAEGRLKGLITGSEHNIERKGFDVYSVDNLTRVAIIGNEKWLVPATEDERRFAVFNVGSKRRKDRQYFESMRVGMEQGGYSHLLHYFQTFDLSTVDVNEAPETAGLVDQKHASLEPVQEWWLGCLMSDEILGSDFHGEIPDRCPTHRAYSAFTNWAKARNIRSRLPDLMNFVKLLRQVSPTFEKRRAREDGGELGYSFFNPGISILRDDWDKYIGGKVRWED